MQVIITSDDKREIDYILDLIEKSNDAELIGRSASVCGKGEKSEVIYILHIEVTPELQE